MVSSRFHEVSLYLIPLIDTFIIGEIPMIIDILVKLANRKFGTNLLGVTWVIICILLRVYNVDSILVPMSVKGMALERYALQIHHWF